MSKKADRLTGLVDVLKEKNGATVKDLAQMFCVSEMTIRRDLEILKSKNVVSNVYGAAIYNPSNSINNLNKDYNLLNAQITMDDEKTRIGALAASFVEDGDVIIIDVGSTTEKMALSLDPNMNMTIICYTYNILTALNKNDNLKLIVTGGYFHPGTQMFESPEGISLIRNVRAKKVFVSAAGIHDQLGITCANGYETSTKRAIIESGAERILLADSTKFGKIQSSFFAYLSDFQIIITDKGISPEWEELILEKGIKLYKV